MTGGNASVIVSTSINPTINGEPLENGDEIAVFTPEDACAGAATWNGSNMSITVWGDDSITPEKDGFTAGDDIEYKVWDASVGVETDDVDVSYSSDQPFYRSDGTYAENAIYVLSSIAATIALPEPGVPALASPANEATDVSLSPTLTWGASSDAASYDVQVSTTSNFSSLFDSETGITSTDHSLAGLSEGTVYYWRARAVNESGASAYSGAWSFTTSEPDAPEPPSASAPAVPALSSPAHETTDVSASPTLTWEAANDAASYDVQISATAEFTDLLEDETGLTSTSHALSELAEGTEYFWRVRAVNESGASAYSGAWSFTTTDPVDPPAPSTPAVPALSSPAHETTDVSATPTLTWEAATDAASYDVQVSATAEFTDLHANETGLTSTSHALSELAEGREYFWRVRAVNETGASEYSAAWSFTTTEPDPGPGSPPGTAPSTPALASPADAVTDVSLTPTLTWEADTSATSYTLEVSTTDDFSSLVASKTDLTETSHILGELAEGTAYFWRLQAVNENGESPFTAAWTFTTEVSTPEAVPAPGVPVLTSPSDDAEDVSSSPTFAWKASSDAASYELQVSTKADFSSLSESNSDLAQTNYSVSGLAKGIVYYWRVRAVNETGTSVFSDSRSFTTAAQENSAPGVANAITDQALEPGGASYTLDLTAEPAVFSDADGDAMSFSASSDDTSVAEPAIDGTVLSVVSNEAGSAVITVTATDDHGLEATLEFTVTVQVERPNSTPAFKSSPVKNTVTDVRYSYRVSATDTDDDVLTLTAVVIPSWLSLKDNGDGTGELAGKPMSDHVGVHEITVTVSDDRGASAQQTYYLSVTKKNNAPHVVFTETDVSHPLGDGNFTIDLTEVFKDADGDPLVFGASSDDPNIAAVELSDDKLIVTPRKRGTATIKLTATDSRGQVATASLTFTVEYNNTPVAGRDYVAVDEGTEMEIDVLANDTDPDDDALGIEILTAPSHGTAVVRDDKIAYTPSTHYYGPDSLVYEISDGFGGTASELVVIEVTPAADAPTFPAADAITKPEDGAHLVIGGETADDAASADLGITIEWNAASAPGGVATEYVWELAGTEDFSETLLSVSVGADTSIYMTYGEISDALAGHGVDVGTSISGYHRVVAEAGGKSRPSVARSISLTRGTITSVNEADLPQAFSLDQNYPNPFNPQTTISYTLERAEFVTVKVFDVLGKEVATLVDQEMAPGQHSVRFDAGRLNSGTYFYRLNAGSYMATKQMILLK